MSDLDPFEDDAGRVPDSSEAIFSTLGSQIRLDILFALAEAQHERGGPVTFAEIHRRVDMRDSSKFNYHLSVLRDHFVEKTDAGYQLKHVGKLVYRAVNAETYDGSHEFPPEPIDSECYKCGADLLAGYDDGQLTIRCADCVDLSYRISLPPSALADRSLPEVLHAADRRVRADFQLAASGVCPSCAGTTVPHRADPATTPTDNVYFDHVCLQCEQRVARTTVGESLLYHPDVVAFHRERGVEPTDGPVWELGFCVCDVEHVDVVSDDPWRARLEIPLDGDVLRLMLDADLSVVETTVDADVAT